MNKLVVVLPLLIACKDKQEAPKVDITAEHLAAVNAAIPADLKKYFTCRATLGTPAKGLADVFEKVCSKVSGD